MLVGHDSRNPKLESYASGALRSPGAGAVYQKDLSGVINIIIIPDFGTLVGKPWHPLGVYSSTTTTVPAPGMHTQWVPRFESTKVTVWDNNNANNTTEVLLTHGKS